MKCLAGFLLAAIAAWGQDNQDNVNSRYTVESVKLEEPLEKRISQSLRSEVESMVGQKFDQNRVSTLAKRLHREVRQLVNYKVVRGDQPEHIGLVYESKPRRWDEEDTEVTKLSYHSKQGWTGGVEGRFDIGGTQLKVGTQSDGDALLERYAGVNAGVAREIGRFARLRFDFETFHEQWNRATTETLLARQDVPGIYRERYHMHPALVLAPTADVTVTVGVSVQHFQTQFPAARFEASNALQTTLRYRRRWSESDLHGQELDAGYNLRAATRSLGSDFAYSRHQLHARYAFRRGHSVWSARFLAGALNGTAPLFDRFILGNTETLRGWNKYDLAPVGADRVAHGSVGYRYRALGAFYDVGSVWERNQDRSAKHAVGVTVALGALRDGPYLTLAFPLRDGSITPLFMMGMNF